MKLASLKQGRDGKLLVVDKKLAKAAFAEAVAPTLQGAMDDWASVKPRLEQLARDLESGKATSFPFDPAQCMSPLPRAYQWADGSAYLSHVKRVRRARGAELPPSLLTDPLMYQGGSDSFLGPRDDILVETTEWGIDFEAEVAVITGDVPMGIAAEDAKAHIRLIMLVNDVSLRGLVPSELEKGFGFFQSKPSSAFSPVAVTPDELEGVWKNDKLHLPIYSTLNGTVFGHPDAGADMQFSFAQLIAHAAKTRSLSAGTIIGSGTVSNEDASKGYSCLVEKRLVEKVESGHTTTPFLQFGDTVEIDMKNARGESIFGVIRQTIKPYSCRLHQSQTLLK
jgi:fumarylacetoacetate (FAA) hydrolase